MVRTYLDEPINAQEFERVFPCHVADAELVWHRDHNTRSITVLAGHGWKFQLDNQLPQELRVGDQVLIPAQVYHRLIKGSQDLKLRIFEHESNHLESAEWLAQKHHVDHVHQPLVDHSDLA